MEGAVDTVMIKRMLMVMMKMFLGGKSVMSQINS